MLFIYGKTPMYETVKSQERLMWFIYGKTPMDETVKSQSV